MLNRWNFLKTGFYEGIIYLDPPFNSKRLYNAFMGGAQWVAFDDTWRWYEAIDDFHDVASQPRLSGMIEGLRMMLGEGPQLAYLSYMANRLIECHRVLKRTGSLYLHCDPTMSHYLKAVADSIFGLPNFKNEIIWNRSKNPKGSQHQMRRFSPFTDTILYYGRSHATSINLDSIRVPLTREEMARKYPYEDTHGRYADGPILRSESMGPRPNLVYSYEGFTPGPAGWRVKRETLERIDKKGNLAWTKSGGVRRKLRPQDIEKGKPIGSLWDDIPPINSQARERLGYPTQKPLALMNRIIAASSKTGDLVLDPFCGCGTTIHAAQNLGRRWIGVDICVNACKVIEERLRSHFDTIWDDIDFIGMPKTADDAKTLASLDKFRFERWAASLVDGMEANTRQRGDKGIDGWGRIPIRKGQFVDMVSQVKGGGTGPGDVQAFNGARQQAGADLGIFTCFDERVNVSDAGCGGECWSVHACASSSDLHRRGLFQGPRSSVAASSSMKGGPGMPKPKKERGRPMKRPYPPRIDATPEQLVQAMFSAPPDAAFEEREYRCSDCGREVGYPETLYRDGRCEACHAVKV